MSNDALTVTHLYKIKPSYLGNKKFGNNIASNKSDTSLNTST